ncbi:hypothetical protein ACROYT_G022573 [Oculina patagonica]
MNASYFVLMAFHLVGVLFNLRMLASCFKDKAKYTILQKCRPFMIFQCILQLTLLACNAYEVTRAFDSQQIAEWCGTNGVVMSSVGFLMIYNVLAMLAIEHHTIVGLKRQVSPRIAILIFGIIICGILFLMCFFSAPELCASNIALTVACSWLMILILWVIWRVCTHVDHDATKTSTETYGTLPEFLRKNKTAVFFSALIFLAIVVKIFLDVISSGASSFQEFLVIRFLERVIYLYIMCFAVSISLPLHFLQIIESSPKEAEKGESSFGIKILII